MNESAVFGPGVQNLWLNRKKKRSSGKKEGNEGIPTEVSNLLGEAESHYINGQYAAATKILSTIVQKSPHLPEPFSILALIYEEIGDSYHALQLYALAASLASKKSDLWEKVFIYGMKIGEYEQALSAINRCIKLRGDQDLHRLRIMLLIKLGKIHSMRDSLKTFQETFGDDKLIYADIGSCFYNQGYLRLALDYLQRFLSFALLGVHDGTEHPLKAFHQATYDEIEWMIENLDTIFDACRVAAMIFLDFDEPYSTIELLENLFERFHQLKEVSSSTTSSFSHDLSHVDYPMELLLVMGYARLLVARNDFEFSSAMSILQPLLTTVLTEADQIFGALHPKVPLNTLVTNITQPSMETSTSSTDAVNQDAALIAELAATATLPPAEPSDDLFTTKSKGVVIDPNEYDHMLFLLKLLSRIMYQLHEHGMLSRANKLLDFLHTQCTITSPTLLESLPNLDAFHQTITFLGKQSVDMQQYDKTLAMVQQFLTCPIYTHTAMGSEPLVLSSTLLLHHFPDQVVQLLPHFAQYLRMMTNEFEYMMKKLALESSSASKKDPSGSTEGMAVEDDGEEEEEDDDEEGDEDYEEGKKKTTKKNTKASNKKKASKAAANKRKNTSQEEASSEGTKRATRSSKKKKQTNDNNAMDVVDDEEEAAKAALYEAVMANNAIQRNVDQAVALANCAMEVVEAEGREEGKGEAGAARQAALAIDQDEDDDDEEEDEEGEEGDEEDEDSVMMNVLNIAPEILLNLGLSHATTTSTSSTGEGEPLLSLSKNVEGSEEGQSADFSGVNILAQAASIVSPAIPADTPTIPPTSLMPTLTSSNITTSIVASKQYYFTPWHDKAALHRHVLEHTLQVLAGYLQTLQHQQDYSPLYCALLIGFLQAHYKYIANKYRLKTRDNILIRYLWPRIHALRTKTTGYAIEKVQTVPGVSSATAMTAAATASSSSEPSPFHFHIRSSSEITLGGVVPPSSSIPSSSSSSSTSSTASTTASSSRPFEWFSSEAHLLMALVFYFSDYIQIDTILSRAQLLDAMPRLFTLLQTNPLARGGDTAYVYELYHYIQLSPEIHHSSKKTKYCRKQELSDYLADPLDEEEQLLGTTSSSGMTDLHHSSNTTGGAGGGRKKYYHKKDDLLEGIRQSTLYRSFRGGAKKINPNDTFLLAAERISLECKEAATLVLQDLTDISSANILFHIVVHHMLTTHQQPHPSTHHHHHHFGTSSSTAITTLSAYDSLFLENQVPVRYLLTIEDGHTSAIAQLLSGHHFAIYKKHHEVIEAYLQAYQLAPNQSLISLCLGSYLIMLASHPLIKDRMDTLLKGFAFLLNYRRLRLSEDVTKASPNQHKSTSHPEGTNDLEEEELLLPELDGQKHYRLEEISIYQETLYNLGRAYQELKLNHLACQLYQEGLKLVDDNPRWYAEHGELSVTKEIAHNLIVLYQQQYQKQRHLVAKQLALQIMHKYLKFA